MVGWGDLVSMERGVQEEEKRKGKKSRKQRVGWAVALRGVGVRRPQSGSSRKVRGLGRRKGPTPKEHELIKRKERTRDARESFSR